MIRDPLMADTPKLLALAVATGLFSPDEAEALLGGVLRDFHEGKLAEGHHVRVLADDVSGVPLGWVYFAPAFKSPDVWDLWWIGVDPPAQKRGVGGRLLDHVEDEVRKSGARILIVETSTTPPLEPARRFYLRRGYAECGTIPDFYSDGDGKRTFAKRVAS